MENSVSSQQASATWHLMWQAAIGRNLVSDAKLLEKITGRLIEAHQHHGRQLLYYLVTSREIHVICRVRSGDSPREVAREVATIVARWVRELQGVRGPVFADRYRAHEITQDASLKYEIRMLAWRPVVTGECSRPLSYVNSSLRMTLGQRRAYDFESRALLSVFEGTVLEARDAMRKLIRRRPSSSDLREWELNHGLAIALGAAGASFGMAREVDGAAAALVAASPTQDIDGALMLLERWVAFRLGAQSSEGLSAAPGPSGARARALVAGLAVQWSLCPAASVARYFSRSRATLCEQMAASRQRVEDCVLLGTPIAVVLGEVKKLSRQRRRQRPC